MEVLETKTVSLKKKDISSRTQQTISEYKNLNNSLSALEQLKIYPELFSKNSDLQSVTDCLNHYINRLSSIIADKNAAEIIRFELISDIDEKIRTKQIMQEALNQKPKSQTQIKTLIKEIEDLKLLKFHFLDLTRFLNFLGNLRTMQVLYKNQLSETVENLYDIFIRLKKHLVSKNIHFYAFGRKKALISYSEKVMINVAHNKGVNSLKDIYGFRIILKNGTEKKCYEVMNDIINFLMLNECIQDDAVTDLKGTKNKRIVPSIIPGIKDYILNPKVNGYQSLHGLFITKNKTQFEIQVRTDEMDFVAEKGTAAHDTIYKQLDKNFEIFPKINMEGFQKNAERYTDYSCILDAATIFVASN